VLYYIIFDPLQRLKKSVVRVYKLEDTKYKLFRTWHWLPEIGLGLKLWQGEYEGRNTTWLRWCDEQGNLIPTGAEKAEAERQRAERLAAKLRAAGIDPDA
jgi:hypothetical protein